MKKILTYGTFDTLHFGHILLLQRARALGDHLTVGLSSDAFNDAKGKRSFFNYDARAEMLGAIRYVNEIIPENSWSQKADDIQRLGIEVFVMGDDWAGKFDDLSAYCEVKYLSRTPDISSTMIRSGVTRQDD